MQQTVAARSWVPDHVPASLIWDHSIIEYSTELEDPYMSGARLHDGPDIFWCRDVGYGKTAWVVTRIALQEEIYTDPARFSSDRVMGLNEMLGVSWYMQPIESDPPVHTAYRQILNPYFSPRAINAFEGEVRKICDTLISAFENRDGCEYISEFAIKFPSYVFLTIMGMPLEMLPQFLDWDHTLWRTNDVAVRKHCALSILRYLESFLEEQKRNPTTDLMRGFFTGTIDGRPLTMDEILGMVYLLYTAGLDTVYSSLGWHMRYLASDVALQDRLRSRPEDIPRAVEELTRAFSVVNSVRKVTRDMDFHGVAMRKGDEIAIPTWLSCRDPNKYANPHVVDIDRQPKILSYATGAHTCVGMHLARREMKIVMQSLLSRFKNIRMREGEVYKFHGGGGVVGVDYLPITWERI
jgi:cytochrome P450